MRRLEKGLEKILNGDIEFLDCGICANTGFPGFLSCSLISYFVTWEYYTGDHYYPVPDPAGLLSAQEKYDESRESLWEGAYGELRLDLARHMLAEVRKEV